MARFRETVRSLLREHLLDTAYALVAEHGFDRLRMSHLATAAGVSRQTLYSELGSKDEVGEALFQREVERCMRGIELSLARHPGDLRAAVAAAVEFALRLAADNPLVQAMFSSSVDHGMLRYLTTRPEAAFATAEAAADAYAAGAWPQIDPASRALAVQAAIRLTASHVMQSDTSPAESARRIAESVARIAGYPAR
ncbi:TetR/AcrR family transcriptional regulator [Streptomyces similanensis]|uniref:TetR/AcrR family transcriptional regulator n=1 Tax=Streptomyces similanensis TaxID=1274988 RepID=A0ABP9JSN2_9ACTN|nr:TetR family transcriptional regulator [Streptomyces seoulensis]